MEDTKVKGGVYYGAQTKRRGMPFIERSSLRGFGE
jgi:hypothetical protein